MQKLLTFAALLTTLLPTISTDAAAQKVTGVTATEIKVGATFPFSGPGSAYSVIGKSMSAYVDSINDRGGIRGRKIKLIMLDDAYSPSKAIEQTRKLVEDEEVAFLFSQLGTAPVSATLKYVNSRKIPQLLVMSGASKFINYDEHPYTTSGIPSYTTEGTIYAKFVTQKLPGEKIAILYQNDDLGKDFVAAFRAYLKTDFDKLVVTRSYESTDPTVDSQIVNLKNTGAAAFVIIGSPKTTAQGIRKIRELGWNPLTVILGSTTSIGGTLTAAGLDNAKGIYSSTFLKDVMDPNMINDAGVANYRAFLTKYLPSADITDFLYVGGVVNGEVLEKIIEQCGDDLSRENIMKQALNLRNFSPSMAMPGVTINTGPKNHQVWTALQMQQFDGKTWVPFGKPVNAND